MPLVIEAWDSPIPGESRRISVAHCLEQGGDLVPDPEVEITDAGWPIDLSQALAAHFGPSWDGSVVPVIICPVLIAGAREPQIVR